MQGLPTITNVKTLAERLRWARERIPLTQQELADRAGVSQGTIGNVESGERKRPRELLSIATALSVPPLWLQEGKGDLPEQFAQEVAQDLSLAKQTVTPKTTTVSWGDVMKEDLPQHFTLTVEDDAMAPLISKGDVVRFSREAPIRSGRIVLVVDRAGRGYIRTYEGGGDTFDATPMAAGYRRLNKDTDGLRVAAVWMGW